MTVKKRQYTKNFSLILALAAMMIVFMTPNLFVNAADEDTWAGLQTKLYWGGTVKLDQDYTAGDSDAALVVPAGRTVILDLNGHTIDRGLTEATGTEPDGNVITVNGNLTITDTSDEKKGTITGGYNNDNGGGIIVNENASFIMDGGTISGNSTTEDGGGVYLEEDAKTFIMNGGAITGNSATVDGGGVGVNDGTFTMNGGTISSNNSGTDQDGYGGGVYINDRTAEFIMNKGSVISSNKANAGGGVFLESGKFTMIDGTISENSVENDGGGVFIYSHYCQFSMKAGSIIKNKAEGNGGGVYTDTDFELSGGSISENTAGDYGGGIYTEADINMTSGEISANKAYDDGGGVYFYGDEFAMSGGTIKDNESLYQGSEGGGVYVDSGSEFTMTGTSSIENNKSSEEGGGVFVIGKFTMDGNDATISGNTTGERGGGIACEGDGYFVINKGTVKDNIAESEGGGLYVRNSCVMNGGSITGNKALSTDYDEGGGGVSVGHLSNDVFTMTGGEIKGNTSVNLGGGINVESGGVLNLSGSPVITGNKAGDADSNVYLLEHKLITITGALRSDASVGVAMETPGVFTTGYRDKMASADPADYFTSDDENYNVVKDENGEAKIGLIDIKRVDITIDPPVCGDTIKIENFKYPVGARPEVTLPSNAHYSVAVMDDEKTPNANWGTTTSGQFDTFEDGYVLDGGQTYTALVYIQADKGYHIASDVSVTVNGKAEYMYNFTDDRQLRIYSDIKAVHNLVKEDAKAATCEAKGNIDYWTCRHCNKIFSNAAGTSEITEADTVTDALGHELGDRVRENEKAAECTKIGGYDFVMKCTRCGEVINRTHVVIPSQGHQWSDWINTGEAEEGIDAKFTRTCSVCGETETKSVPAPGHEHNMQEVAIKPATCTEDGTKAHWKCTSCYNSYADAHVR